MIDKYTLATLEEVHYFLLNWQYTNYRLLKLVFGITGKPLKIAKELDVLAARYTKLAKMIRTRVEKERRDGENAGINHDTKSK